MSLPFFAQSADKPLANCQQLVLVLAKTWDSVHGDLHRFERADGEWKHQNRKFGVSLGRNGLGRGRGLNSADLHDGPEKQEGDGKSPAGAFRLSSAFGYAPHSDVDYVKLPYVQCTKTLECVDDDRSTHYNSIVDRQKIDPVDWKSSEQMLMETDQYRLGIVVDHNVSPAKPGGGSCIFLHIWKDQGAPTSGCTAMADTNIVKLLHWLDPKANPTLVQLTEEEYLRLQKDWDLPNIPAKKPPGAGGKKKKKKQQP